MYIHRNNIEFLQRIIKPYKKALVNQLNDISAKNHQINGAYKFYYKGELYISVLAEKYKNHKICSLDKSLHDEMNTYLALADKTQTAYETLSSYFKQVTGQERFTPYWGYLPTSLITPFGYSSAASHFFPPTIDEVPKAVVEIISDCILMDMLDA